MTSSWERGWEETSRGVERTISLTRLSETRTVSLAHVLQALPVPLPPSGPHPPPVTSPWLRRGRRAPAPDALRDSAIMSVVA